MDSPGVEKAPTVYKFGGQTEVGTGRSAYSNNRCWMGQGSLNNSSKNNPCFLGDIIGDWREEIVTRTSDKLIIQTTSYPSAWGITTLWADHVYRNGMCWQPVGYNQPPHTSFFLGELEDITNCPPAQTLEGRTEVANGGTITTTDNQLLISGYEDKTVAVAEGASPYVLTVNAPAWVQGTGSQQATASTPKQPQRKIITYTTTLTGGAFSGTTRLIKQGEGVLVLPNVVEKHTGETNVWNGTLQFDGTFESSPLWLNRHTTLISNGGKFMGGIKADYNATIYPGGKDQIGNITASTLTLGFGSRMVIDGADGAFDQVNATKLSVEAKTEQAWVDYGPLYKAPVLQFKYAGELAAGVYELGAVGEVEGLLKNIILEGIDDSFKTSLTLEDGKLKLVVEAMRSAGTVTWNGVADDSEWQEAVSENFLYDNEVSVSAFGDDVIFDDNAASTTVTIKGAVSPKTVTFNNETKNYVINGDSIIGGGTITKNGKGTVTFNNWNHTGNTTINGGIVVVSMLANNSGQTWGSLGNSTSQIYLNDGTTLRTNGSFITDQTLNLSGETTVDVPSGKSVIFNKGIKGSGAILNKTGAGSMEMGTLTNTFSKLVIKQGTVTSNYSSSNVDQLPRTVEFQGGTLWGANMEGGSGVTNTTAFVVPKGKTGTFYSSFRGTYTGTLTGEGTFNVYTGGVRAYFNGNWSNFEGTINIGKNNRQNKKSYDPEFLLGNSNGMPKATVNVNANARLQNQGMNIRVKKFGGTGTLVGSGQWIVDNDENFSLTTEVGITSERTDDYGNTIQKATSPLTKRGKGKMTMTAGKMYGTLKVEDGTVAFNNILMNTLLNGSSSIYLKEQGRLVGQGLVYNVTCQTGTELIPCASTSNETTPGTIKCDNKITVNEGATVTFLKNSSKNSKLNTKNLTINGTIKLVLNSNYTPKEGDELTLWTVSGTFSGTPQFDLPNLPGGLAWDTSLLTDGTGVLSIIAATGIRTANAERGTLNDNAIYDVNGRLRKRLMTEKNIDNLPAGIYIRGGKKIIIK